RLWVKTKMSVVAAVSRFSHRTLSVVQSSPQVGGVQLTAAGLHRYSNWKSPVAIQALQQVCALTLRVMKLVTTALLASPKTLLCSFLLDDWTSAHFLKLSKNWTLENLS